MIKTILFPSNMLIGSSSNIRDMESILFSAWMVVILSLIFPFALADQPEHSPAEQEYIAGNGYFLIGNLDQAERAYENAIRLSRLSPRHGTTSGL